nr:fibronectin type III domain-containing protein [Chitinophagaceae bacterium]
MKRFLAFIVCLLGVVTLSAQTLIRGPYMTSATSNSVIIQWQTDIATTSQVRFGLQSTNLNNTFTSVSYTTQHAMKLTGLQPETNYFYSIGNGTQVFVSGSDLHFTTLPLANPHYNKPVRMWTVGDIGKQTQQQINVRESFKQYVGNKPVHGWIMLGDNAYETGSDFDYQHG